MTKWKKQVAETCLYYDRILENTHAHTHTCLLFHIYVYVFCVNIKNGWPYTRMSTWLSVMGRRGRYGEIKIEQN